VLEVVSRERCLVVSCVEGPVWGGWGPNSGRGSKCFDVVEDDVLGEGGCRVGSRKLV